MISVIAFSLMFPGAVEGTEPFKFAGQYVEGCSCGNACVFELKGQDSHCDAVCFYRFDSGSYKGMDLAGTKMAFAGGRTGWLRIYFDGPTHEAREAVRQFALQALKDYGKLERVAAAKISVERSIGTYQATIDGIATFRTTKLANAPKSYSHIFNATLHPMIFQAETRSCTFADGTRHFKLKNSNSFFNSKLDVAGKV